MIAPPHQRSPVHLAIDALAVRHSGALTVLNAILHASERHPAIRCTTVFCQPEVARSAGVSSPTLRLMAPNAHEPSWRRVAWSFHALPKLVTSVGADALLTLSGTGCAPARVPAVVFLQQALVFAPRLSGAAKDRARLSVIRAMTRIACRRASLVVAQTPEIAEAASRRFGVPAEKVRWWLPPPPWPVGRPRMGGAVHADGFVLLYVGNDARYKNLPTLFEAVDRLRARLPVTLLMAGARTRQFDMPSFATHEGLLEHSALPRLYARADALVMPSLVETVGLPLIEAMSLGVPVVAADRPYARRVCGEAAAYFDPESAASLCEAVARVLVTPGRASSMSCAGIARAEQLRDAAPYDRLLDRIAALCGPPLPAVDLVQTSLSRL